MRRFSETAFAYCSRNFIASGVVSHSLAWWAALYKTFRGPSPTASCQSFRP